MRELSVNELDKLKPVQIKLGYNQPLGMRHRAQSI